MKSNKKVRILFVTCFDQVSWLHYGNNKNIARIANAVPVTLYSRDTMNVEIVVLNCHKCNQCLKGHKSRGLVFEGVL